jgi:hypothetical protein
LPDFARITIEGYLESLLMAFWKKKKIKKSKVHELKEIETLGRSIEKIKTLIIELKIIVNFKEINSNFSKKKKVIKF